MPNEEYEIRRAIARYKIMSNEHSWTYNSCLYALFIGERPMIKSYRELTEQEIVEICAKAMHLHVLQSCNSGRGVRVCGKQGWWNPLRNNADALELAEDTETSILFHDCQDDAPVVTTECAYGTHKNTIERFPDSLKQVRKAITITVVDVQRELESYDDY